MPAIQPARLKKEAAELAKLFSTPEQFVRALRNFMERYADHTRRPGQTGIPVPLLPAYNVPTPVLRRVMLELAPRAEFDPETALILADLLWEKPFLEYRLLAARLLGLVPASDLSLITTRVKKWAQPKEEGRLLDELFDRSLERVRQEDMSLIFPLIREWAGDNRAPVQILGLKALLPLVRDSAFDNLPLVFRLLSPRLIRPPIELRPHLLDVLQALARRSPQETAHFLRQALIVTDNPGAAQLVRQTMGSLPNAIQENLKEVLRR